MREISTGEQIWRSPDGASWQKASPDGFGNENNNWSGFANNSYVVFNGSLVKSINNDTNGAGIWQMNFDTLLPGITR